MRRRKPQENLEKCCSQTSITSDANHYQSIDSLFENIKFVKILAKTRPQRMAYLEARRVEAEFYRFLERIRFCS